MAEGKQDSQLHFLDYWRVIRSRKEIVIAVSTLIILSVAVVTLFLPRIYYASAKIKVEPRTHAVMLFNQEIQRYDPLFYQTQFELIKARPILEEVVRNLGLAEKWGEELNRDKTPLDTSMAVQLLKRSLDVRQFRNTSLIEIGFYSENKQIAKAVANEMAETFKVQRDRRRKEEIARAIEYLQKEYEKQREAVERAQDVVEEIRKKFPFASMSRDSQGRMDLFSLQRLEAEASSALADLESRKARLKALEELSPDDLRRAAGYIISDPNLQVLEQQLTQSDVNLQVALTRYGENHPEVKRLQRAVEKYRKEIDLRIQGMKKGAEADVAVAQARYDAIRKALDELTSQDATQFGEKYRPYDNAVRDLTLQENILDALETRIKQEVIGLELPSTMVEIVETAELPKNPVKPNFILNILLGILVGVLLGVGLAYFIEYMDTSIKTVDDVEKYLELPVLGVIPQKVRPLIEEGPDSPHGEAYRVLRTNLQFALRNDDANALAIISGGVGEGKSTTLFNLAYISAQLGDKVLIVDSDLRRPRMHKILDMDSSFGLTNVLMRDVPIEEAIKTTSVPNLHFLPSGKLPRTSVGMLNSERMRELIKTLKARYDLVLFDSPPIVGVSDASVLASEVDAALLVVQYRKYPKLISARAKQMIENVGGRVVGVVLNNINIMRDDYYYYYHTYYYHYYRPEDSDRSERAEKAGVGGKY